MIINTRFTALATLAAFLGTSLLTPIVAQASEEGKRNTTLGLGAAAAALLLTQKNKLPGAVVGAGAVYSGIQYQNSITARHRRAAAQRARYARMHRRSRHNNG